MFKLFWWQLQTENCFWIPELREKYQSIQTWKRLGCLPQIIVKGLSAKGKVKTNLAWPTLSLAFGNNHKEGTLQWHFSPVTRACKLTTASCFACLSVSPHGVLCFVYLVQEWKDYKLSWNTTEYGGVQSIRLPSKMIWTPDILMYNRYTNTHFSRDVTNILRHKNSTLF